MTTLLLILLVLAFLSGAELFAVMLGASALGALTAARGFTIEFDGMIASMFGVGTGDQATVLSTIPMFIYAGYVLAEAKTADRLVRFANALMGWMPGGLAIVTIGTCALFTTFTGASGVTIVALGGVLMPALVRSGYPQRFSIGMLAGTGSVGLLFPPALPLFIYGTVYGLTNLHPEIWDTRRFLFAGIVPGIVLVTCLSIVAVFAARKLPRQKFELGELGRSFVAAAPELFIPFGVIGGLALGFALPEIAALTVVYVVVLEVGVLRMVKAKMLWTISREAMVMVGAIFVIILASSAFTNYLVTEEVPKKLVDWTQQYVESKVLFLLALNVLLLFVGMVMDIFSAIVIVLPLIGPIAKHYGIDPYHLGVIFLLNLEVGYMTPPVGLNLYIASAKFQKPVIDVIRAVIPFMLTTLVALLIVTYVPALTIVPEPERTGPVSTLQAMVVEGIEESKVSIAQLELVDATGAKLLDEKGQPIVRKFADCTKIEDETAKTVCQSLFFDVTDCIPKGTQASATPEQQACATKAIADWVVSNLNGDPLDLEKAVITVKEVAMVDAEGNPILGASGTQIVKKYETCAPLTGTTRDTCRSLFIAASSCTIMEHDVEDCVSEKSAACPKHGGAGGGGAAAPAEGTDAPEAATAPAGDGAGGAADEATDDEADSSDTPADPACVAEHATACRKDAIAECIKEAAGSWADEYPDEAKLE